MNFDVKNIIFGIALGVLLMLFIGNVDIETKIELGENNKENQNIQISIEQKIDNNIEMIEISVQAKGSVTKNDIEKELEELYSKYDIDPTADNVKIEIEIEEK